MTRITPNVSGDWLNQRRDDFGTFIAIGDKSGAPAVFHLYSGGPDQSRSVVLQLLD
ncbi:MAG: hypothetical protein U0Q21_05625 [Dermatophilaceae bacterium]